MPALLSMLILSAGLASVNPGDFPSSLSTPTGLSGYWRIATGDFVPDGEMRLGAGAGVLFPKEDFGTVPLVMTAAWGLGRGLEAGASIPFYIHDSVFEEGLTGDVSAGIKYLYETARGGTSLSLTGSLSLPTGDLPRDRGAEAGVGFCTSTVYRLVRLSVSAQYFANGGDDPFSGRIVDGIEANVGCTSYILPETQVWMGAGSRTGSDPVVAAGAMWSAYPWLMAGASGEALMADDPSFGVSVSVSMYPGLL